MAPDTSEIIRQAEADLHEVETFRANERGSSRPGDPERQRRIDAVLHGMFAQIAPLRSLIARSQWADDVLTPQQRDRVDEISRGFQLNRRQLKKMR